MAIHNSIISIQYIGTTIGVLHIHEKYIKNVNSLSQLVNFIPGYIYRMPIQLKVWLGSHPEVYLGELISIFPCT